MLNRFRDLKSRSLRSFRLRLALGAGGLALVTLLGVGAFAGRDSMMVRREFAEKQLASSTRNIAALLSKALSERAKEVAILGGSQGLTQRPFSDPAVTRGLELRKNASPEYAWIGIAGADGKVLAATGGLLLGVDVSARPWFKAGTQGAYNGDVHEAVLLAKLLPSVVSEQPLRFIDIAVPVLGPSGELRGVLGTHLHSSWIGTILREAVAGDPAAGNVRAYVVARDGTVLHPVAEHGKRVPMFPRLQTADTDLDQQGRRYLVSREAVRIVRGPDLGWSVVLAQPLEVAMAPALAARNRVLLLGIVVSVVIAAIAYGLATTMSRPLERLVGAVRRAGEGQAGPDTFATDWGTLELSGLSQSVRRMSASLADREARTQQLAHANRELSRLAEQDALTGVANRRALDALLRQLDEVSQRTGQQFGLLLIDVDRFKSINDTFGHPAGDAVLRGLASLLMASTRKSDLVARFGGEEFAVVMPELTDPRIVKVVGEKIRSAVERHNFDFVGPLTVSIGCAAGGGTHRSAAEVIALADGALYKAKHSGRNRCVEDTPPEVYG